MLAYLRVPLGWTELLKRSVKEALADNILQIFNAPLFLTVEVLFLLGYRNDLRLPAQTAAPLLTERS